MRDQPRDQVETVEALTGMEAPADAALFLVVYGGERSRVVDLPDGMEITIGRSRGATLSFPSDERLSRVHVRLRREKDQVLVEDQGSRNGTRINGHAATGSSAAAAAGDAIDAGSLTLLVARRAPRRHAVIEPESALDECLQAEVYRATRYVRPLSLLMLRLDGPPEAVDEALDRIATDIRPMDRLASYSEREVALVLPETASPGARAIAEKAVEAARAIPGVTAAAGLACVPDNGSSPGALVDAARTALRIARRGDPMGGFAMAPRLARPLDPAPREKGAGARPGEQQDDGTPAAYDPRSEQTFHLARKVAATPITVLLLGETGAGKEVVAELIHRSSPRGRRPFVRLDCASLPPTLLESELFGHERGAFTGAERRKIGYFEAAEGGTILLDEIGELPPGLQAKLLTALERRVVCRLGSTEEIPIDVRVIAATNRDLEEEVKKGRFREDLYYRLAVFTIFVPPLRDRPGDIMPLATGFARQFAGELGQPVPEFSDQARAALESYGWPGNVRELRNAVERAVVLTPEGHIGVDALPESVQARAPRPGQAHGAPARVELDGRVPAQLVEIERSAVVAALEACGGNQTQAARRLGMSRRSLIYKMERFGLKSPPKGR